MQQRLCYLSQKICQSLPWCAVLPIAQLAHGTFRSMRLAVCLAKPTILRRTIFIYGGYLPQLDQSYTLDDIDEDDPRRRVPPPSAAAAAAAAAAAVAAVAALDPSKPLPKVKARSHKKKKPEELLANMTGVAYNKPTWRRFLQSPTLERYACSAVADQVRPSRCAVAVAVAVAVALALALAVLCFSEEQRAEHEKQRAVEKAVRLAAQAQAAGVDLKDLKLPASLQPAIKQPKPKK